MAIAVGVVLLLVGLFHLAFPYVSWFLSIGWKIRDAEPSDAYLGFTRVGGGIAAGVGLITLIVGILQALVGNYYNTNTFATFAKEMTVSNIRSIREQHSSVRATPAQIREFVHDIRGVEITYTVTGGGFSGVNSFTISCRDGYAASLINVDNGGMFGVASGTAWGAPDYEFHSASLARWAQQVEALQPGG